MNKTVQAWIDNLKNANIYNHAIDTKEFKKNKHLSQTWKLILRKINLQKSDKIFEVGCGGGKHLVELALQGYNIDGIDCSREVLSRCNNYIKQVESIYGKPLKIKLYEGDFFTFSSKKKYKLAFNFGVIEHFMEANERKEFLKKKLEILENDGWGLAIVPSGIHVLRNEMREKKLGGYDIEEIDYSMESLKIEFIQAGFQNVQVFPIHFFGYLINLKPVKNKLIKLLSKTVYVFFNLFSFLLSKKQKELHGYMFVALGQKLS